MSNALYSKYKQKILGPGTPGATSATCVDLIGDTIKVALVNTGSYSFSAAHEFYSSVSAAVVGTPQTVTSKSVTDGVFKCADVVFSAVTGATIGAVVFYKDTGTEATSSLIAYLDTVASGLPATPTGGNITLSWSVSGVFAL